MRASVLFVCTGNVCRSPMAELFLRTWAREGHDLTVASAGMQALVGEPIDPPSGVVISHFGVDGSAHRARQYEPSMAVESDLVLTAERAHRDEIITRSPALFRRVFTMKEFVRLAEPMPAATIQEFVAATAAQRGRGETVPGEADDLVDPFRGPVHQARAVVEEVSTTIRSLLAVLGLDRPAGEQPASSAAAPAAPVFPRPGPG